MANFLRAQPRSEDDRNHTLRMVFMVPLVDDLEEFSGRFNLDVKTLYNTTETAMPILSSLNPRTRGSCGRLRPGAEARLVDEFDQEVPAGAAGELILRSALPWEMNSGYWGMPEETARAWRNGWFHTGDSFRASEGNYFFVDRLKDAIRRRGENISSFEIEAEVLNQPGVREAAAIGVPSLHGEEDVLVAVAPIAGQVIDPASLFARLVERLPHFMVPRYIRVLDELPKTATSKVSKYVLRADRVAPGTWDREAQGMTVKREKIR